MNTDPHVVIVGMGAAGHAAASTLRQEGHTGPITAIHAEPHAPYNRTLVNKGLLPGLLAPDQIALPGLDDLDIEVIATSAVGVDPGRALVLLDDGRRVPFGSLVVATGSAPRIDASSGHRPWGRVFRIHSAGDAVRLRDAVERIGSPVVTVLGAGFIGAETASHFAQTGAAVNLVSRSTRPLAAALGEPIAQRVADLHRQHVRTWFGHEVQRIEQSGDGTVVMLEDGHRIESDLVVVAHGTAPVSQWATGRVGGVAVDERLRITGTPNAYAAGSVALHTTAAGEHFRVDHWEAAAAQGAHAARSLLHDQADASDPGPYVPDSGYTLHLHRTPIAVYGVALPGAEQRHETAASGGIVTRFLEGGRLTAVAGMNAGAALSQLRSQLVRP